MKKVEIQATKVPKGEIKILKERCKGCEYCVQFCPKQVLEMSKEYSRKGYHFPLVKNPQECIWCNLCGLFCPDFAIYFTKSKESKESKKSRIR